MIATNLHADTYEEARDQIRGTNGVSEEAFRRVNLLLFIDVRREGGRIVRYPPLWGDPQRQPPRYGGGVESSSVQHPPSGADPGS